MSPAALSRAVILIEMSTVDPVANDPAIVTLTPVTSAALVGQAPPIPETIGPPVTAEHQAMVGQRFPEFTITDDRVFSFSVDDMAMGFRMAAIVQFLAADPAAIRNY